jgi:hypothetical protein
MQYLIYASLISLAIICLLLVTNMKKLNSIRLLSFGRVTNIDNASYQFYSRQLKKYSIQQSWSFALLVVALLGALILAGILLYTKIILGDDNADWLPQIIGLGGGSGVSYSAFRLYRAASKKVDDLMSKIAP